MKESSGAKSRRPDRPMYNKRNEYESRHSVPDPVKSGRVLKEQYKKSGEDQKNMKRSRESHSEYASHNKKTKNGRRSVSPPHVRRSHHKNSPLKANVRSEDDQRNKKHHSKSDAHESYEELSRRKRRIESELHALDLEEAAEKEAKNKKPHRQTSESIKRKEGSNVPVKEEPHSDDSEARNPEAFDRQTRPIGNDLKKRKRDLSKSSGDEKNWGSFQAEANKVDKTKEKPNFTVSGKLAEDTNTFNGIVIKYNEPAEARKPRRKWRLYPFKGDSNLPFIPIHRQSAYLFGRTRMIADIPIDHPSCSKQHAVLQYRLVSYKREDGTTGKRVRPYIIDLDSSNGTFVNNKKIDARCYVELMEKDVVKFGFSSREYVLLHEESKNELEDDDVME